MMSWFCNGGFNGCILSEAMKNQQQYHVHICEIAAHYPYNKDFYYWLHSLIFIGA